MQGPDAVGHVAIGDELGVFSGHEQDVAEPLTREGPGFALDLRLRQGDPQDGVVPRKAAVGAVVDALVAEVQRGEQADGLAEPLASERLGSSAEFFEPGGGRGREQRGEIAQRRWAAPEHRIDPFGIGRSGLTHQTLQRQGAEGLDETHVGRP